MEIDTKARHNHRSFCRSLSRRTTEMRVLAWLCIFIPSKCHMASHKEVREVHMVGSEEVVKGVQGR